MQRVPSLAHTACPRKYAHPASASPRYTFVATVFFIATGFVGRTAEAQLPSIALAELNPCTATVGSELRLKVTAGRDLDEISELLFSDARITASPATDTDGRPIANEFVVRIPDSVPAGSVDVRVAGLFGISNPRRLLLQQSPTALEVEPNNAATTAMPVLPGMAVSARSDQVADVDWYAIDMQKGQRLTVRCRAAAVDSVMQPVLSLFDPSGSRLATARRMLERDASLSRRATTAGRYLIKVHDVAYAGGDGCHYCLEVTTDELVDVVLPTNSSPAQGLVLGRELDDGRPVPGKIFGQQAMCRPLRDADLSATANVSMTQLSTIHSAKQAFLIPPTAQFESAVRMIEPHLSSLSRDLLPDSTVPTEIIDLDQSPLVVYGTFGIGGQDTLIFRGSAGDVITAEVFSRRLGCPSDPMLLIHRLTEKEGQQTPGDRIAINTTAPGHAGDRRLARHRDDPFVRVTLPADSLYQITVRNRYAASAPDEASPWVMLLTQPQSGVSAVVPESRTALDPKQPDQTAAYTIRRGETLAIPVYARRFGSFAETITIDAANLPPGVTSVPAVLPDTQSEGTILLTAASDAVPARTVIRLTGTGDSGKFEVNVATLVHPPQNGLPQKTRLTDALPLQVLRDPSPVRLQIDGTLSALQIDTPITLNVASVRSDGIETAMEPKWIGLPPGLNPAVPKLEPAKSVAVEVRLPKDSKAAPGTAGVAYLVGQTTVKYRRNPYRVERLTSAIQSLQSNQAQLESLRQQLQGELQKTSKQRDAAQASAQTLATRLPDLRNAVSTEESNVDTQRKVASAAATRIQHVALDSSVSVNESSSPIKLRTAAGDYQQLSRTLQQETEQLRTALAALAAAQTKLTTGREALSVAEKRVADLTTQQATLAESISAVTRRLAEQKSQSASLAQQIGQLEEQNKQAKDAAQPKDLTIRVLSNPVPWRISDPIRP